MLFSSENGSTVKVSGKHNGIFDIEFDWFEEGMCCDGHPTFNNDLGDPKIVVYCDCCGTEEISLKKIE